MTTSAKHALLVRDPRTGEVDFELTPATAAQINALAGGLRRAQGAWAAAGVEHRAEVLRRWADAIEKDREVIGGAEMADTGRSRVAHEVPFMVAAAVRGWCDQAPAIIERARLSGVSSTAASVSYDTEFAPYALVGVISPWNHPFLLSTLDAIPALLAGCAVMVKPSEITPRFVGPVSDTIAAVPELAAVFRYVTGGPETG